MTAQEQKIIMQALCLNNYLDNKDYLFRISFRYDNLTGSYAIMALKLPGFN